MMADIRFPQPLTLSLLLLLLLQKLSSHVSRGEEESKGGGTGGQIFASSAHLRLLAEREVSLLGAVERYVRAERTRLDSIESALTLIRSDRNWKASQEFKRTRLKAEQRAERETEPALTDNPLATLRLIERFVTKWPRVINDSEYSSALVALREETQWFETDAPSPTDQEEALLQLVRLQETYALPLDELAAGRVGERVLGPPLAQATLVQAGLVALKYVGEESDFLDDVIRWLRFAVNHTVEPLSTPQEMYHGLARAYALAVRHKLSLEYTKLAIEHDPANAALYLTTILPPPEEQPVIREEKYYQQGYYRLCRQPWLQSLAPGTNKTTPRLSLNKTADATPTDGLKSQIVTSSAAALKCVYKRTALRPYDGYKTEFLHHSPDVVLFHDVITDSQSTILRELAVKKLKRATIGPAQKGVVSLIRLGKTAWLRDNDTNTTVRDVTARIADVTGLNSSVNASSPLQMSNYGFGGHNEPHYDHFMHKIPANTLQLYSGNNHSLKIFNQDGDRIATFMLYLNDVMLGGATVFPELGLAATPVKNAGIFWYNYFKSGNPDDRMLHAGCPVLLGEKWVANKWIHEGGQVFTWPCDVNADM